MVVMFYDLSVSYDNVRWLCKLSQCRVLLVSEGGTEMPLSRLLSVDNTFVLRTSRIATYFYDQTGSKQLGDLISLLRVLREDFLFIISLICS
jgi:hypothetical protein